MFITSNETFSQIEDFPSYYVSDHGNVGRVRKDGSYRLLTPWLNEKHFAVSLHNEWGRQNFYVHRLVLIGHGPEQPEELPLALHINDDKSNNHIANLCWGNKSMNARMAIENGCHNSKKPQVFLTVAQANVVKDDYRAGVSTYKLADRFGCSRWTISNIVNGRVAKFL